MTTQTTIRRGTFRHVEAELYGYDETKREIQRRREEIMYPYEEPNEPGIVKGKNSVRQPGDPTERVVTRLMSDRRLRNLEEIAEAIRTVYEQLPNEKQKLVRLKYWTKPQRLTWDGIALQLDVSRRTAINWRDQIVKEIAEKIGWR